MRSFCSFLSVEGGDLASLAPGGGRTQPERAQQRICPKRRGVQILGNHRLMECATPSPLAV